MAMKKAVLTIMLAAAFVLSIGVLAIYGQEEPKNIPPVPQPTIPNTPRLMMQLMDLDKDGRISEEEYKKFFTDADQDKDGFITNKEVMDLMKKKMTEASGPNVGDDAPGFALNTLDGKSTIKLSDFKGSDIIVLVFGSYT
jgi:Ca2+-binding EF-hand superfamily protein